jgi:outer membrane murein-binding lipoprotein Lpp
VGRHYAPEDHILADALALQNSYFISAKLFTIESDVKALKDDVKALKEDVKALKDDVKALKEDGKALKEDVKALKEDVNKKFEHLEKMIEQLLFAQGIVVKPKESDEKVTEADEKSVKHVQNTR